MARAIGVSAGTVRDGIRTAPSRPGRPGKDAFHRVLRGQRAAYVRRHGERTGRTIVDVSRAAGVGPADDLSSQAAELNSAVEQFLTSVRAA